MASLSELAERWLRAGLLEWPDCMCPQDCTCPQDRLRSKEGRRSQEAARQLFLIAVADLEPRVLRELAGPLFTVYCTCRDDLERAHAGLWPAFLQLKANNLTRASTKPVLSPLHQWARRWRLRDPWCYERAWETLGLWYQTRPDKRDYGTWDIPFSLLSWRVVPGEGPFRFEDRWSPARESEGAFRKRAGASFERELDAYVSGLREMASTSGMVAVPEMRQMDHFRWLAMFQVSNRTYAQIALSEGQQRQTVDFAVKALAKRIGLSLKPAARGGKRVKPRSVVVRSSKNKAM